MKGIHYVIDYSGRRVAVQIDLRLHGGLWEELEDALVARERESEQPIPYEQYRAQRLRQP